MSYNVARRTNEIGIRMALGAQRQDVLRLVMRESMILVVIGVGAGLALALFAGRFVSTLLYGVPPADPLALALAILVMVAGLRHRRLHPGAPRIAGRSDGGVALRVSTRITVQGVGHEEDGTGRGLRGSLVGRRSRRRPHGTRIARITG